MALIIDGQPIVSHETEFAVRFREVAHIDGDEFADQLEVVCSGEVEARATQMTAGGEVVSREVYLTDWALVDE